MLDLRPFAAEGHGVSGNDVTGIADKAALVSTIKLMDDRTSSTFPTFTPTLFPFVDFRFIGFYPHVKGIIRVASCQRSMLSHFNLVSMLLLLAERSDWLMKSPMIRFHCYVRISTKFHSSWYFSHSRNRCKMFLFLQLIV